MILIARAPLLLAFVNVAKSKGIHKKRAQINCSFALNVTQHYGLFANSPIQITLSLYVIIISLRNKFNCIVTQNIGVKLNFYSFGFAIQ